MRNKAILRDVEADGHGRRVTIPQVEIDVAQAAVKREFAGIGNGLSRCRAFVGVPKHVVMRAALEVAGMWRQNEDGAMCAVADEANSGPNVDGMLDAVTSFGNEDDAMVSFPADDRWRLEAWSSGPFRNRMRLRKGPSGHRDEVRKRIAKLRFGHIAAQ